MTSPSAQLQQPPKQTKYRAPVAPVSDHTQTDLIRPASERVSVDTIEQHLAACVKYRAPAPPTPPPPSSLATSAPVANNMRREPMQVLRTNSYNNNDVSDTPLSRGKHPDDVITAPTVVTGNERSDVTSVNDVVKVADVVGRNNDDDVGGRKNCVFDLVGGDVILEKPIVSDVKLLQRSSNAHLHQRPTQVTRSWRSTESIDKLNVLLGDVTSDRHVTLPQRQTSTSSSTSSNGTGSGSGVAPRSSFVDPNNGSSHSGRRSVYIDLGEYQTLLKHGKEDAVYSLPQPQCYGDETLRAVRLITEKYDTFKRRQLRALSFRDSMVRPGYQQIHEGADRPDRIIEGVQVGEESVSASEEDGCVTSSAQCSTGVVTSPVVADVNDTTTTAAAAAASCDKTNHLELSPPSTTDLNIEQTECCHLSTMSRNIVSLSRYGIDALGHVGLSSVEDVSLLPSEAEVTSRSVDGGVSRTDRLRVEMFYRSRETTVYVCSSMADLFVGASPTTTMLTEAGSLPTAQCWVHLYTGVPVWLLNSGNGKLRRRELILVLADRLTGMPLWRDRISYLSNYSATATVLDSTSSDDRVTPVHCLRMSNSLSKVVRLAMFDQRSADTFFAKFKQLTSDPNDDLWKISDNPAGGGGRGLKTAAVGRSSSLLCSVRRPSRRRSVDHISKSSISLPCSVVHVCRVDPRHPNFRAAFSHLLIPPVAATATTSGLGVDNNDQLPSGNEVNRTNVIDGSEHIIAENNEEEEEYRPRLPTN